MFFFLGIFCKRNCMVTSRSRISGIPEMVVPWIPYAAVELLPSPMTDPWDEDEDVYLPT